MYGSIKQPCQNVFHITKMGFKMGKEIGVEVGYGHGHGNVGMGMGICNNLVSIVHNAHVS